MAKMQEGRHKGQNHYLLNGGPQLRKDDDTGGGACVQMACKVVRQYLLQLRENKTGQGGLGWDDEM